METTPSLERVHAQGIADKFRRQGYEVIEEPSHDQMPNFLTGYRPDLILRKGDESVVVEVKSRESLIGYPRLGDLTELLRSQPGWRLELIVVSTGEQIDIPRNASPFTRENILQIVEESQRLLADGFVEAALLRGWTGTEATLRLIVEEEGMSPEKAPSKHILQMAATEGLISLNDYDCLARILECRNAYAHGFTSPDFDATLVGELIETTKRILHTETTLEPV